MLKGEGAAQSEGVEVRKEEIRNTKKKGPPLHEPNPQGWATPGERQSQNLLSE
jgi:hypothetical protein